ncbi:MAG: FG-GAP repeat protein, partial [Deltaproteobacteria bacterium]|nr:FG-GAP repeat protein [Deltaproteobacteria bacterium]
LESDQRSAHLGESVASAGDVNGDGYDDVVVGAGN